LYAKLSKPACFVADFGRGLRLAKTFRTISAAIVSAKEEAQFATEGGRIASNGFAPDEEKMLDLTQTEGLFDHFEVNREPFWPTISRLLSGSIALHIVLAAGVIFIPPVRDALSVAVMFRGAGFVDRPYNRTQIENGDDIVELTTERFRYPDGYFAMDAQAMPSPLPQIAFGPKSLPPAQLATPSPAPSPVVSPSPAIAANTGPSPDTKPADAAKNTDDKAVAQAQKDLEEASKNTGIELAKEGEVNKKPFKDLASYATELKNKGQLDFEKPFEVSIDTELDKDGKLVNYKMSKHVGDATLVDLGGRLVAAMNDSGILFYLKKINEDKPGTKVVFNIKQNGSEVVATVESEVASTDSARQLSKGFAIMLAAGAKSREGKDEEVLLKSTKVSADGNKVVFSLNMAHQDVVDLVKKGMIPSPSPTVTPSL
jgi:hypothetical protein